MNLFQRIWIPFVGGLILALYMGSKKYYVAEVPYIIRERFSNKTMALLSILMGFVFGCSIANFALDEISSVSFYITRCLIGDSYHHLEEIAMVTILIVIVIGAGALYSVLFYAAGTVVAERTLKK